jgi:hypothetical protein
MEGSQPDCPFCDSTDVTAEMQWGGQIITSQWRCNACNSYFEAVRPEFDDASSSFAIPAVTSGPRGSRH